MAAAAAPLPDAELAAWLSQHNEEPLEPDLPICDAHHHLWSRPETAWAGAISLTLFCSLFISVSAEFLLTFWLTFC